MATATREEKVDAIIAFALEGLGTWTPPTPMKGVGPAFPGVYEAFSAELRDLHRDLREMLMRLPEDRLHQEFPDSTLPELNTLFDPFGRFGGYARRIAQAKKHLPADYIGGWAIEERKADLSYWRGFATIELADLVLLCVGRDPRKTTYDALFEGYGRSDEGDELLYFVEDLYEAIASGLGVDADNQRALVDVGAFYNWVEDESMQIDPRFRRILRERQKRVAKAADAEAGEARRPGSPPHRSSLKAHARVVTAVAIEKYGLKDKDNVGRVASRIVDAGDFAGISFGRKIVRDLLMLGLEEQQRALASKASG